MTEGPFRKTLRASGAFSFETATAARRHAVPAADEVLMAL